MESLIILSFPITSENRSEHLGKIREDTIYPGAHKSLHGLAIIDVPNVNPPALTV
jgi:hypothetical protein